MAAGRARAQHGPVTTWTGAAVPPLPAEDHVCPACRLDFRRPLRRRTVRWLLRNAAHEGRHHLADIERVLAQAQS
jgi:hypothetical protein